MSRTALVSTTIAGALLTAVTLGLLAGRHVRETCPDSAPDVLVGWSDLRDGVHPRWSGCFGTASPSDRRGRLLTPLQLRGALASFEIAARRQTRGAVSDFAVALALAGESARAIATLQTAADDRVDADTLSNLAGVHLTHAGRQQSSYDSVLALNYTGHALILNRRHQSARFNEALALTALGLTDEASRSWQEYLRLDPSSAWSDAARSQLAALEQRMPAGAALSDLLARHIHEPATVAPRCQASAQTCREYLEEVVLGGWADAYLAGDSVIAGERLALAHVLAEALRPLGDGLHADTVAGLDASATDDARLRRLARGIAAYVGGRQAFDTGSRPSADLFAEAEQLLTASQSPLAGWARVNRIYAQFPSYDGATLQAIGPQLFAWAADARARGYTALEGRLLYFAGLSFGTRAEFAIADDAYARSAAALEAAKQADHLASTYVSIATARFRLGSQAQAWTQFARALTNLTQTENPRRRYVILLNAGVWMGNTRLDYAAIRLLTLARDAAIASNEPRRVAEASLYRAKAYARLGFAAAARTDLDAARPDAGQQAANGRAAFEYLAGVAEVEASVDPGRAIDAASAALPFFEDRNFAVRVANLRLLRGRAHTRLGALERAADDFASGIATYEHYRSGLTTDEQRITSMDVVWDLYEEQLSLVEPGRALDVAERARARTLVDALRREPVTPVSPAALRAHLQPDQRVIYYAATPRQLLIWVIADTGVSFAVAPITRAQLERRIATFLSTVQTADTDADWLGPAEQLFDVILRPVQAHLPRAGRLILVPDGALHRVPFASLRDARTRRLVSETYEISVAPSATFLMAGNAPSAGIAGLQHALVVGNPRSVDMDSAALAGAETEARAIAGLYPTANWLTREGATKSAFLAGLNDANVVHFAGHAVASPDFPLLAHLELANEPDNVATSILEAHEIAALRLTRTQLVVLAACQTGVGAVRAGEGVLSLARPFLVAGAPTVIATLWDIDDAAAAPFFYQLHRRLAQGLSPSAALAATQRDALRTMPPSQWAAFVVIGRSDFQPTPALERQ